MSKYIADEMQLCCLPVSLPEHQGMDAEACARASDIGNPAQAPPRGANGYDAACLEGMKVHHHMLTIVDPYARELTHMRNKSQASLPWILLRFADAKFWMPPQLEQSPSWSILLR